MSLLIRRVDLLWRQTVVNAGGQDPDPIVILRPGEKPKKKPLRGVVSRMLRGG
jgi:hypothetical protein